MPSKRGGRIVMEVAGSPVLVVQEFGVLYIATSCCLAYIRHGSEGVKKCSECDSEIRTTRMWSDEYKLNMHCRDEDLVRWLSFWTGVEQRSIAVEVRM